MSTMRLLLLGMLLSFPLLSFAMTKESTDNRVAQLEARVMALEQRNTSPSTHTDLGAVSFLFGAFCALWAQNTGRSPWLWFFLGLFFSVITVIFLLMKNGDDKFDRKVFGRTARERSASGSAG